MSEHSTPLDDNRPPQIGTPPVKENAKMVALRESAVLLRAVAENTSVGLVLLDRNHRYKFANDVYLKILGRTDSIIGKTPAECLPANYENQTEARINRALAGEKFAFEAAIPSQTGPERLKYYSAVYEPDYDEHGEIIGVVVVIIDITEQTDRDAHTDYLSRELIHRSKNLLSVVAAIAKQTKATSQADFLSRFIDRLQALDVSQDLLVKRAWKSIDMAELFRGQLAHLKDLMDKRILLDGPQLSIRGTVAETLGMVIHELSTNAMKYGALSGQTGAVDIAWRVEGSGIDARLFLRWHERGGPTVTPPAEQGFGAKVLTQIIEINLGGKSLLDFAPQGLKWQFDCPAANVLADGG